MRGCWRGAEHDPSQDHASADVFAAYDAAERGGLDTVECYCAGVAAWRRAHPDQTPAYASRQAVAVIPAAKISLRIVDDAWGSRLGGDRW